jgi:hypothetical protein
VGKKKAGVDAKAAAKAAHDFIDRAMRCEEKTSKSVGCGDDHRFKGAHIAGSTLVHSDTVIHTALLHRDQATADGQMSSLNRRHSYRMI